MFHDAQPQSRPRTLVTGFGPFGTIAENPTTRLARDSSRPFRILEVSYAAVDLFLLELSLKSFDRLVLLGVAGTAERMRLETVARNQVGPMPDVRGITPQSSLIDPDGPAQIWRPASIVPADTSRWEISNDAGTYLCNYLFYRALRQFPGKRVWFIHVPPFEVLPSHLQQEELNRLLEHWESTVDGP